MLSSSKYIPGVFLSSFHHNTILCWRNNHATDYLRNITCQVQRCFATGTNSSLVDKSQKGSLEKSDQTKQQVGTFVKKEPKQKLTEPLVPNLFLGKLDPIFLVYPEVTQQELDRVNELIAPIEKFYDKLDSRSIDVNSKIPDNVLQEIKDLGLFGLQIPEEYGGLNLNAVEYARMNEVIGRDGGIAVTLAAHQAIGFKAILIAGTEEQKRRYLPKLATGEHVAAFCLTEPSSGSDAASIQSKATLSDDGKTWNITGGKIWISNGGIADVFTVFAKTDVKTPEGETVQKVTAFIVERGFGGVTSGKPEDKLGIRGSNTSEVHFDNTPVPVHNVIGEVGQGFKIAMRVLNSGRFSMGSSGAGVLKYLIGMAAEHARTRTQFGRKLAEFGLIQEKFAKIAVTTYVMESMTYLTAGLLDTYEDPDMSVEAAIVKVFSSEGLWNSVSECMQVLGGLGYMKEYPYERFLRDSRILLIFEGTNEILRLFIALQSLKHAGATMKDHIKKLRNPFNNPGLLFKAVWNKSRGHTVMPVKALSLHEDVHPELEKEAKILNDGIYGLAIAVENILSEFGNKTIHEQMKLRRLADVAIDLYAITACIGRATRSICVGLRNCDHEVLLTRAFCYEADQRIKRNLYELTPSQKAKIDIDDMHRLVAEAIFKNGRYAAEHPLTRNW